MQNSYRVAYLICGFIQKTLSIEEEEELDKFILASESNMQLFEDLTDENTTDEFLKWYAGRDTEGKLIEMKKRLKFRKSSPVHSFWKYAAAACLLGIAGFGIYFIAFNKKDATTSTVAKQDKDIQPGSMYATLKLAGGKTIVLNGSMDTTINEQIQIKNGEIVYDSGAENQPPALHEIVIPRKGFFKLVLPDGTNVWLNSASSIRYPNEFTRQDRRVMVTGETYFEVAKDTSKPFIVSVNGIEVRALGTAFNINAYPDEPELKTTLIEGSIKVSNDVMQEILKPNEQVNIRGKSWMLFKGIETDVVTAWTHNKFKLRNNTIEEVMQLVERWYDAKIIYKDKVNFHFNGLIDRGLPVSELLKLLEATGHVHFAIDGNTITVKK